MAKKKKCFDFIADKKYKLFSAKSTEGVVLGPRIKGSAFHLTAYSRDDNVSVHTTRNCQREKTIIETDKRKEYLTNLAKKLAEILLTDEFTVGELFEVKQWFLEESEDIRKLPDSENLQFDGFVFVLSVLNKAQGTKEIADFNTPVEWKDIDKHKMLSNRNNDLLLVYNAKAYKLTSKNIIELVNFVFETFGVNDVLNELGLQKESFTSLFENQKPLT